MNLINYLTRNINREVQVLPEWYEATPHSARYYIEAMHRRYHLAGAKIVMLMSFGWMDKYDCHRDCLHLTESTLQHRNTVSIATACHEVGHEMIWKYRYHYPTIYQYERAASWVALTFLKEELTPQQFAAARAFLVMALNTYK